MNRIEDGEKFEEFLKVKQINPSTITNYLSQHKFFFKTIGEFNKANVLKFLSIKSKQHPNPRAFVKNYLEYIGKSMKLPKVTGRKGPRIPQILTREEVIQLCNQIEKTGFGRRNKLMLMLMWEGALRVSELCNLVPRDFRIKKWEEDPTQYGEIVVKGKGKKQRTVYIGVHVFSVCCKYIGLRRRRIAPTDRLFNIGVSRFTKLLYDASSKCLSRKVSPHIIRHSRASYLLQKGLDIKQIQLLLGHARISATEIYLHISNKDLKASLTEALES